MLIELITVLPSPGAPSRSFAPAGVMSANTASAPKAASPIRLIDPLAPAALFSPVKNACSHARIVPHAPPERVVLADASNT